MTTTWRPHPQKLKVAQKIMAGSVGRALEPGDRVLAIGNPTGSGAAAGSGQLSPAATTYTLCSITPGISMQRELT